MMSPDRLFDFVEPRGGLLDAHAHRCAHMHQDLAAIHLRKEVAAEERRQQEGSHDERQEAGDEEPAMLDGEREHVVVAGTQLREAALESPLKAHQRIAEAAARW